MFSHCCPPAVRVTRTCREGLFITQEAVFPGPRRVLPASHVLKSVRLLLKVTSLAVVWNPEADSAVAAAGWCPAPHGSRAPGSSAVARPAPPAAELCSLGGSTRRRLEVLGSECPTSWFSGCLHPFALALDLPLPPHGLGLRASSAAGVRPAR